jgi:hypothetical protein
MKKLAKTTGKSTNDVIKMFFYWIVERHKIFLARQANKSPPWTTDPILQKYKFTNPFRQNDRVTRELGKRLKKMKGYSDVELFWAITLFRMFNYPPTFDALSDYVADIPWNVRRTEKLLNTRKEMGSQIFTGAYIITNNGSTRPKITLMCEALGKIWERRADVTVRIVDGKTIENAVSVLCELPMVGKFIGYEIATDLRHTRLLGRAKDINFWANPGPGARRGCNRIFSPTRKFNDDSRNYDLPFSMTKDERLLSEMRQLLKMSPDHLPKGFPVLEMRDIEHSLCEFDKYMRVKLGEGRPRSMFTPTREKLP